MGDQLENHQLKELFDRYLDNRCSTEEVEIIVQYFNTDNSGFLQELVAKELLTLEDEVTDSHLQILADQAYQVIDMRISKEGVAKNRTIRLRSTRMISVAAAIATIVFGVWLYTVEIVPSRNVSRNDDLVKNDITPGKQGATLTLANGKKISLTDAANGNLAKEGGVIITKSADGQVVYEINSSRSQATSLSTGARAEKYNMLSTANGETYIVTLPDHSKVWLNAASSLKYPSSFARLKERKVELNGEAYFEVAKDKSHPFIVKTGNQEVEVLGTHFNINAYKDERATKTTLVEGSVKVRSLLSGASSQIAFRDEVVLKPKQQATLADHNKIEVQNVDTEAAVSWKNGDFIFNKDDDLRSAMRKIARWYDVEVIYDPSAPQEMEPRGWMSRENKLSTVLKRIESTGKVHFKIEGRRVIVMR